MDKRIKVTAESLRGGKKNLDVSDAEVGRILDRLETVSTLLDRPLTDPEAECIALIALARSLAEQFSVKERTRIFNLGMAFAELLVDEMRTKEADRG